MLLLLVNLHRFVLDALVKMCKYWDVLDPVLERASSTPIAPTGTLGNAAPVNLLTPQGTSALQGEAEDEGNSHESSNDPPTGVSDFQEETYDGAHGGDWDFNPNFVHTVDEESSSTEGPKKKTESATAATQIALLLGSDDSESDSDVEAARASMRTQPRVSSAKSQPAAAAKPTQKAPPKPKPTKPLSVTKKSAKPKQDFDDVLAKAFADRMEMDKERNQLAKQKLAMELAHGRVKYAKELKELGIFTDEQIKEMAFGDSFQNEE